MTAEEWEACRNPASMVDCLRRRLRLSERKAQLLAVACCRRIWSLLLDPRSRAAVEVVERAVDAPERAGELAAAAEAAYFAVRDIDPVDAGNYAAATLARAITSPVGAWACDWISAAADAVADSTADSVNSSRDYRAAKADELATQARLIRCVFGNPFRPPFTVSSVMLAHDDGAAVKLATVIYEERDPATGLLEAARLGILADALEEAGVDDRAALNHLREPGPHYRGCHVLDAVLGRG